MADLSGCVLCGRNALIDCGAVAVSLGDEQPRRTEGGGQGGTPFYAGRIEDARMVNVGFIKACGLWADHHRAVWAGIDAKPPIAVKGPPD
ncbi:hypothetical protein ACFWPU_25690 [Streptomyces sp. NPDC058471]|uniref:hypothetical protein n=1 Tax=Streptomyces sp. NPDC058471 TaxID=3346516 RepID=UPI00365E0924